jgi:hypothetical protein
MSMARLLSVTVFLLVECSAASAYMFMPTPPIVARAATVQFTVPRTPAAKMMTPCALVQDAARVVAEMDRIDAAASVAVAMDRIHAVRHAMADNAASVVAAIERIDAASEVVAAMDAIDSARARFADPYPFNARVC